MDDIDDVESTRQSLIQSSTKVENPNPIYKSSNVRSKNSNSSSNPSSSEPIHLANFWTQTWALLKKNLLLKKRNQRQTFQEIFIPLYYVGILILLRFTAFTETEYPAVTQFPAIPVNLLFFPSWTNQVQLCYSPNTTSTRFLMTQLSSYFKSNLGRNITAVGFANPNDLELHYNNTRKNNTDNIFIWAGLLFNQDGNLLDPTDNSLKYTIRMNSSLIPSTSPDSFTNSDDNCRNGTQCPPDQYISIKIICQFNVV